MINMLLTDVINNDGIMEAYSDKVPIFMLSLFYRDKRFKKHVIDLNPLNVTLPQYAMATYSVTHINRTADDARYDRDYQGKIMVRYFYDKMMM